MTRNVLSSHIPFEKPDLHHFLKDYNELLAKILLSKSMSLDYISSPTLNRQESLTHLYEKLEKYRQIREFILKTNQNVHLVAKDTWLYPFLKKEFPGQMSSEEVKTRNYPKFFLNWCKHFIKSLIAFILGKLKDDTQGEFNTVLRTYFDYRCLRKDNSLREEYFGDFCDDLGKKSKLLVIFKFMSAKDFVFYWKARKSLNFKKVVLENFIGLGGIIIGFLTFLNSRIRLKDSYVFRDLDITSLIQKSLDDDFFDFQNLGVFLEYQAAKKLFNTKIDLFYYPYENQPWEKVYPFVKHLLHAKTKIIGFQHTGVSYKLLNYFPSKLEISYPYFPDKILTVGETLRKLLKDKAFYPCPIEVGAALRHQKYTENGQFQFRSTEKNIQNAVAYAFSYDQSNYGSIFESLIRSFGDSGISVYLKIHPDYAEAKVIAKLGIPLPSNFILAQKREWMELYKIVDCIFFDDNSIGLEGLIQGVKTFNFKGGDPIYHCDRMFGFTLWESELDETGMQRVRLEIEMGTFDKTWDLERISDYVKEYYTPYLDYDDFAYSKVSSVSKEKKTQVQQVQPSCPRSASR